jgi:hypothetical protein
MLGDPVSHGGRIVRRVAWHGAAAPFVEAELVGAVEAFASFFAAIWPSVGGIGACLLSIPKDQYICRSRR